MVTHLRAMLEQSWSSASTRRVRCIATLAECKHLKDQIRKHWQVKIDYIGTFPSTLCMHCRCRSSHKVVADAPCAHSCAHTSLPMLNSSFAHHHVDRIEVERGLFLALPP